MSEARSGLLLALDGALGPFSAALIALDGSVSRAASAARNDALERGLALVEELLNGRPLNEIRIVAVTVGPGAFTGLRIALSFAKSFAFARRVPLVGLPSYDVVERDDAPPPSAAFVTGRSGMVCGRLRLASETIVRCGSTDAVAQAFAERVPRDGTLECAGALEGVASRLGELGTIVRASTPAEFPPALALARKALRREPSASPHRVRADYGSQVYYAERP
jgi:tRNA threonylcarbamoyl adenosine modification protein YeaZ